MNREITALQDKLTQARQADGKVRDILPRVQRELASYKQWQQTLLPEIERRMTDAQKYVKKGGDLSTIIGLFDGLSGTYKYNRLVQGIPRNRIRASTDIHIPPNESIHLFRVTPLITMHTPIHTTMHITARFFVTSLNTVNARVKAESANVASIEENYRKEFKERKRLFNLVQELRGNIRVFCRIRPLDGDERKEGETTAVVSVGGENDELRLTNAKGMVKNFEFDKVFGPEFDQAAVFAETAPLCTSVLDGFNVCIFAYGQTGSGKTYTMEGPADNRGVNFRALELLFNLRDERAAQFDYEISVSLLEVYNEQLRDLLAERVGDKKLAIKQGEHGMYVPGLTMVPVNTCEEVLEIMRLGYVYKRRRRDKEETKKKRGGGEGERARRMAGRRG